MTTGIVSLLFLIACFAAAFQILEYPKKDPTGKLRLFFAVIVAALGGVIYGALSL